jgi:signal transduction histidine kinase/CheY-like chemotaxis protein
MQMLTSATGPLRNFTLNERRAVVFVGAFLACLITARFGASFYNEGHSAPALIWFPAGIALALIYLESYYLAIAVALGIYCTALIGGAAPLAALIPALANALQASIGAYLLQRFGLQKNLNRLHDATVLIVVSFLISAIVPTISIVTTWSAALVPLSVFTINWSQWGPWWLGEFLSALVVAPVLIRWLPRPGFHRTTREWVEFFGSFGLLLIIEFLLFWTPATQVNGISLNYLILIPLIWMAFRIGARGMTFALFVAPAFAFAGLVYGFNTPSDAEFGRQLFLLEVFFAIVSVLFLLFVALAEERKNAMKNLTGHVDELEHALQKISREDEAKSEFLAILAHELRNPLAPVLSSLELLRLGGASAAETPHLITMMEARVRTMGRLLDDLLDISRISQKKFTLRKERVALQPIVDSAVLTVKGLMESKGHSFTMKVPSRPIGLRADPVRIEQIIVNLLTNAAKYTPAGGKIHFEAKQEGSNISLVVRDTGIGIEEDMLSNIFEPFLQIADGKATNTGLGIGLFLTKNLVTMHDGYIEVRSQGKGTGSEFFVFLPIDAALQKKEARAKEETPESTVEEEKQVSVLLVDDNEAAAQSLGKLLSLKGYDVSLAYTGDEAIRKAARLTPDGVILDIGLPDMEGYEVARRIRAGGGKQPFLIALTGYGQEGDKAKAQNAGFDAHLTKPVGLKELEPVLNRIPR